MTNSQDNPDTTKNYLGLMLMMGFAPEALEKFGNEVEIPDGHIEDRLLELAELRNNMPKAADEDGLNVETQVFDIFTKRQI